MKQQLMKKVVASGLVLAMVMGGSTAAFAQDKGKSYNRNDDGNRNRGKANNKIEINLSFNDMKGADVEWAMRYIASLASKRVFEGYEDGTFKPRNAISRIEAITAAVRLMGLRDQAESSAEMSTKLNFKDADKVPDWAVGYVAVALENDLFSEADDSVQPNKDADRLWATTLLVKALKLEDEAKAKMNTALTFKDTKQIPAGSVGYVAVAVEKGLIDGFEDNTFRPNEKVTRAQLAALLDRTGNQMPDQDSNSSAGTVNAAVYNNVLSLTKAGITSQIELHSNAFIYRNGVQVEASALQVGDEVKIRTYNNKVIFVEVTKTSQTNQSASVVGLFNGTTINAQGKIATVSIIQNVNGTNQTLIYNVSPNVTIKGNLSQLVQNHEVELKLQNQVVTSIEID